MLGQAKLCKAFSVSKKKWSLFDATLDLLYYMCNSDANRKKLLEYLKAYILFPCLAFLTKQRKIAQWSSDSNAEYFKGNENDNSALYMVFC